MVTHATRLDNTRRLRRAARDQEVPAVCQRDEHAQWHYHKARNITPPAAVPPPLPVEVPCTGSFLRYQRLGFSAIAWPLSSCLLIRFLRRLLRWLWSLQGRPISG